MKIVNLSLRTQIIYNIIILILIILGIIITIKVYTNI